MTIEEMRDHLTQIQNESFQTKVLNSILTCYAEIKAQENALVEMQKKINEIIGILNAETTNAQEDALINEPDPQVSEEDK